MILNIFITAKSTSQMQFLCTVSINKLGQIRVSPEMLRINDNRKQRFHIVYITSLLQKHLMFFHQVTVMHNPMTESPRKSLPCTS